MKYILLPAEGYKNELFDRVCGIGALVIGAIGFMKMEFGHDGEGFFKTWYSTQSDLQTAAFNAEFNAVLEALRRDGDNPPFAGRKSLAAFCAATPGAAFTSDGAKYIVQTADYSYLFRCLPKSWDYDIGCAVYTNRRFLPALEILREITETK